MKRNTREIEARNRCEASALLMEAGYRVYGPEADCDGEDLIVRAPGGAIFPVQLKGEVWVDEKKYGSRGLWMLFPDKPHAPREWFLIPHDELYQWMEAKYGHAPYFQKTHQWNTSMTKALRAFLESEDRRLGSTDIRPK